jgi:cysteinyl-tRNA synthetase
MDHIAELDEQIGALQTSENTNKKKNQNDFILWKKSKLREPMWQSPWGYGRPQSHLQCSNMASIFGKNLLLESMFYVDENNHKLSTLFL